MFGSPGTSDTELSPLQSFQGAAGEQRAREGHTGLGDDPLGFGRQCHIAEMSSKCRIGKGKCFEERGLWERMNDPPCPGNQGLQEPFPNCAVKLRISTYS